LRKYNLAFEEGKDIKRRDEERHYVRKDKDLD
jgi:hypothetical protein